MHIKPDFLITLGRLQLPSPDFRDPSVTAMEPGNWRRLNESHHPRTGKRLPARGPMAPLAPNCFADPNRLKFRQ